MLEKIWNGMLHGNIRTKAYLWSIAVLGIGAAVLLVAAFALGLPFVGLGGAGLGLGGLIVSQSVSLKDLQKPRRPKEAKQKKDKKKTEQKKSSGQDGGKEKKTDEADNVSEEKSRRAREKAKAQFLASMDAKKMKKLMKEHKVSQIHVKVMIDSYPAKKIEQVPAFMWKTDTMLHFLLMHGTAIEFEVPLEEIKGILLVKNVPANPDKDYMPFQYPTYISKMFQPYLPEYQEKTNEGKLEFTKNTFRIEPGIYLTNTSVANLRKVLLPGVAFLVDDGVIASKRFNEYFKELYRASLLCKNNVITLDEYREKIVENLDALLEAPVTGREIASTIYDLSKYRLIPKDTVAAYTQKYREMVAKKR